MTLRVVPDQPARCAPLLKWAGGKRRFARVHGDALFARVLERGGRLVEPFAGGAALSLHLGLAGTVLSDVEEDLVTTYRVVRDRHEELATLLALMSGQVDRDGYYRVRAAVPTSELEVAARLVFLNRLCFNGLYRKNRRGEFNVPYGGRARPLPGTERLREVSRALRGFDLRCADFEEVLIHAGDGDVVYADPPYWGVFSDYGAAGFGRGDHERLAGALRGAAGRGAEFYLHNSDTELVRGLYGGWCELLAVEESRSVSATAGGRAPVGCLLITARGGW